MSLLGYLDVARSRSEQAVAWSRQLGHPHALAHVLTFAAIFHLIRRSDLMAAQVLDELISLSTEQRFPYWLAAAKIMRGRLLAGGNDPKDGLALARKGFSDRAATGSTFYQTLYLPQLAQACERAGEIDEALAHLANALKLAEETGERWFEAELLRLNGEWMLAHRRGDHSQVEVCFRQAIDIAQTQNAKLWELRSSVSLSRLWCDQGRRSEAHALLAPVYGWFTQGFAARPERREGAVEGARNCLTLLHSNWAWPRLARPNVGTFKAALV